MGKEKILNATVQGITIALTLNQIAQVEAGIAARKKECNSFVKCLKYFGFVRRKHEGCDTYYYENAAKGWYAEIQNYGNWDAVFMAGSGLRHDSSPPGGHVYGTVDEIIEELIDK